MSKQRTVLQVLPRLVTGGVERGTVEIAAALTKAGWKAIVASAGGRMVEEVERAGAIHVTLPLASKNPLTIWRNADRLADVINQHNVDIVHARSRAPAWSAYWASHKTKAHFVTTFHNAYGAKSALKRLYNSVMAKGERVIAISDFVAAHVQKVYGVSANILRTIPRGVDIERFNPDIIDTGRIQTLRQNWKVPENQPIILLPGRLTRWKGQKFFIDAIAGLNHRDITCLIVGSGDADYKTELQNHIHQLGLQNTVHLVDECRDMPAAFSLADIVVSASTRPEGFGRVIVEAQAMGCLVIATNHGGAAETIIDNQTGWLIPHSDAAALTKCLHSVLALPETEQNNIGIQAMHHVRQNFSTALMAQRTLAVYEEVLNSHA